MSQNPHFAESASDFSEAAVGFMLNYSSLAESKKFLRMKVYIILTVFACMRNADVYEAKSSNVSVMLASNANPRCIKIVLEKTKNDPLGTGLVTGRAHLIPCFGPTYLEGKHKAAYIRLCSADQTGMTHRAFVQHVHINF